MKLPLLPTLMVMGAAVAIMMVRAFAAERRLKPLAERLVDERDLLLVDASLLRYTRRQGGVRVTRNPRVGVELTNRRLLLRSGGVVFLILNLEPDPPGARDLPRAEPRGRIRRLPREALAPLPDDPLTVRLELAPPEVALVLPFRLDLTFADAAEARRLVELAQHPGEAAIQL